jgi:hypothetical protein
MFNEIGHLLELDTILNGKPIGLGKYVNQQRGSNIGEIINRIRICHEVQHMYIVK